MSPSRMLSSPTVMVDSRSIAPISAVVSTTPRRQLVGQTKISCASGTSVPMCTMFHTPRTGDAYDRPRSALYSYCSPPIG